MGDDELIDRLRRGAEAAAHRPEGQRRRRGMTPAEVIEVISQGITHQAPEWWSRHTRTCQHELLETVNGQEITHQCERPHFHVTNNPETGHRCTCARHWHV